MFLIFRSKLELIGLINEMKHDIKIVDDNWLHFTRKDPHGPAESSWAVEKGLSMLTGRKSRWW